MDVSSESGLCKIMDTDSEFRVRVRSVKGLELYETTVAKYTKKLINIRREIEEEFVICEGLDMNRDDLVNELNRTKLLWRKYIGVSRDFTGFLSRQKTEISARELQSQTLIETTLQNKCDSVIKYLQRHIDQTRSPTSKSVLSSKRSSKAWTSSTLKSMILKQKVKLEAARTRMEYVSDENELLRKKLAIEADLAMLNAKKEVEMNNVELEVMMRDVDELSEGSGRSGSNLSDTKRELVNKFIQDQQRLVSECDDMLNVDNHNALSIHEGESSPEHMVSNLPKGHRGHVLILSEGQGQRSSHTNGPRGHVLSPSEGQGQKSGHAKGHRGQVSGLIGVEGQDNHDYPSPNIAEGEGCESHKEFEAHDHIPILGIDSLLSGICEGNTLTQYDASHRVEGREAPHVSKGHEAPHVSKGYEAPHVSKGYEAPHVSKGYEAPHVSKGYEAPHVSKGYEAPHVSKGYEAPHVSICYEVPHVSKGHKFETNLPSIDNERHGKYAPQGHQVDQGHQVSPGTLDVMQGFQKFLLTKDFQLSRLSKFDDRPESFLSWKASFKSVVGEMKLDAAQEIDLLIKWLGPESSRHATSMRNANTSDYCKGLNLVWSRLEQRYGSAESIDNSLKKKLSGFPRLTYKDKKQLYELLDVLLEIQSVKADTRYATLLAYYDSPAGINPVVGKLPGHAQNKWRERATKYKASHDVPYPPFTFFVSYVNDLAVMMNDPGFIFDTDNSNGPSSRKPSQRDKVSSAKTTLAAESVKQTVRCPIHKAEHSLNDCRAFKAKTLADRRQILVENKLCFKCLKSKTHVSRNCLEDVKCRTCGSTRHATGMHVPVNNAMQNHGGEKKTESGSISPDAPSFVPGKVAHKVDSMCTEICDKGFGRSCAKIVPVIVRHSKSPDQRLKCYAILDEQSNRSLVKPELIDHFGVDGTPENYVMSSCSGQTVLVGRRISGFTVHSLDDSVQMALPTVIECEEVPNNREEIPTAEVAFHHEHLKHLSDKLPTIDNKTDILLLIGRDLCEAHHVLEQKTGPKGKPYAQRLALGWVIVGETCLDGSHIPTVNVMKTHVNKGGRPTMFQPCGSEVRVKDVTEGCWDKGCRDLFIVTKEDNKPGMSTEDKKFVALMDSQCYKSGNKWCAPLPFRDPNVVLPDNRMQAVRRANLLDFSLRKDLVKKEHVLTFMKELMENKHAELAPPLTPGQDRWYLPLFGVYHPKKRDRIRCVFDSSAKVDGVSLNDVLLTGPDLVNSLVGVLMRFRKERIAITADIQKMFYGFLVHPEHRDYLRFLWHVDNDLEKELTDYRMNVHVFGNSPSPAVATYLLRKIADESQDAYGLDVKQFVDRNFYVDDALSSHPTAPEAIDLLQRTQKALKKNGDLRLHKICSNSEEVLSAFPPEDLATGLVNMDLEGDDTPSQRSLGLTWDIHDDVFKFQTTQENKPFTRRGVLSVVNSIFDPLGFIAPVTLKGKFLLRRFMEGGLGWDDSFEDDDYQDWKCWRDSLAALHSLHIPRPYTCFSVSRSARREIHVFCDASEKAIAAVAYLHVLEDSGTTYSGFLCGKTKLAPSHGHTIPRLELCAAVLAVEMTNFAIDQLDVEVNQVRYYTDSKVVLGYIKNEKRRFFVYVGNRLDTIHKLSKADQWSFVPTHCNPADVGTRAVEANEMQNSIWLQGPTKFLLKSNPQEEPEDYELVDPEMDVEIRSEKPLRVQKTCVTKPESGTLGSELIEIGTHRYERFDTWKRLVRAITLLRNRVTTEDTSLIEAQERTKMFIIMSVQHEVYASEMQRLRKNESLPRNSQIIALDPYLDDQGILRVGGRINKMKGCVEKNPILLPGRHYVSRLLTMYHHEKVKHMGRHFTEGAVRSAGLWITGGKKLVSSVIGKCVICKRLRGHMLCQKMSDLPEDRLEPSPPFTNVGLDVFGPWSVSSRKTRGNQSTAKRWVVIFSCLVTRAVHFEVLEEMSSAAFINALRRFIAIRGNVKILRSDRGTNFIGCTDDLRIDTVNVEDEAVKEFLFNAGTTWIFNAPHASHMGGAWERLIGTARRIIDSMMLEMKGKSLTHDVFVTFMAEVSAIMNSRPLVPVSSDPNAPFVLSPATLLTLKTDQTVRSFTTEDFSVKDLFKRQWRQVQALANTFWSRWRNEYLSSLQGRRKWQSEETSLCKGDVVLMKDRTVHRNEWPMGVVERPIVSSDGLVRKAEVRVVRDGKTRTFTRPVVELVRLLEQ